jgi:Flp pilus assembly pilin Flp
MFAISVRAYVALVGALESVSEGPLGRAAAGARRAVVRDERGQASAEYALVLLGAAAVALLIVAWATKTDLVGKLLDKVLTSITDKVT